MNLSSAGQVGSSTASNTTPLADANSRLSDELKTLELSFAQLQSRLAKAGVLHTPPAPADKQNEVSGLTSSAPAIEFVHDLADRVRDLRLHVGLTTDLLAI